MAFLSLEIPQDDAHDLIKKKVRTFFYPKS